MFHSRTEKLCLVTAALLSVAAIAVVLVSPETWSALGKEDGGVEIASVFAMLFFAFVAAAKAFGASGKPRLVLLAIALLGIIGAGEEISWGQRIFNIESPAVFAKYNAQSETNLHNFLHPPLDGILAGLVILALLAAPALIERPWVHRLRRNGLPWPEWHQVKLLLASLLPLGILGLAGTRELEELAELIAVLVFTAMVSRWTPFVSDAPFRKPETVHDEARALR